MNKYIKKEISKKEVIGIINRNPEAIKKFPKFWNDADIMMKVIKKDRNYLDLIGSELKRSTEFFLNLIKNSWSPLYPGFLDYAHTSVLRDSKLLDLAIEKHYDRNYWSHDLYRFQVNFLLKLDKIHHTKNNFVKAMTLDSCWFPGHRELEYLHRKGNFINRFKIIRQFLKHYAPFLKILRKLDISLKDIQFLIAYHDYQYALRLIEKGTIDSDIFEHSPKDDYFFVRDLLRMEKKHRDIFFNLNPKILASFNLDFPCSYQNLNSKKIVKINNRNKPVTIYQKLWRKNYSETKKSEVPDIDEIISILKNLSNLPIKKQVNAFVNIYSVHCDEAWGSLIKNNSDVKNPISYLNHPIPVNLERTQLSDNEVVEKISYLLLKNYIRLKKYLFLDKDFFAPCNYRQLDFYTDANILLCNKFIGTNFLSVINSLRLIREISDDYKNYFNALDQQSIEKVIYYLYGYDHYYYRSSHEPNPEREILINLLSKKNQSRHAVLLNALFKINPDNPFKLSKSKQLKLLIKFLANKRQYGSTWKKIRDFPFILDESLLQSKKFAYQIVQASYKNLPFLEPKFLKDKGIISYACLISEKAFRWADVSLKKDISLLKDIFDDPCKIFLNAHISLKTEPAILLPAINKSPDVLDSLSQNRIMKYVPFDKLASHEVKIIEDHCLNNIKNLDIFKQAEIKDFFRQFINDE